MELPEYRITTWDPMTEQYTPQKGVPELVSGFRGLLLAVRLLKGAGYSAERTKHGSSDPSVLIERITPTDE